MTSIRVRKIIKKTISLFLFILSIYFYYVHARYDNASEGESDFDDYSIFYDPNEEFDLLMKERTTYALDNDSFIFRTQGTAAFSVLISGPDELLDHYKHTLPYTFAHDLIYKRTNSSIEKHNALYQPILIELDFSPNLPDHTMNYTCQTKNDIVKLITRAFNILDKNIIISFLRYPKISLGMPHNYIQILDSVLASINRIDTNQINSPVPVTSVLVLLPIILFVMVITLFFIYCSLSLVHFES